MRCSAASFIPNTLVFTPLKQAKGNGYRIELPQASAVLAAARKFCAARSRKGVLGVPYGRREVLDIPTGCATLYADTTNMRMSSRKFMLAEEIARLVDDGKTVYIGCSNADDVTFFKNELQA